MDEREARIRNLLAWARTYHTSVNGIDQAAYDVEQVLAALAATTRERDQYRAALDALAVAIEPVRQIVARDVERQVSEAAEFGRRQHAANPSQGEPWVYSEELRSTLRRERGLDDLDAAAREADRLLTASAIAAADAENKRLRVYVRAIHSCACENRIDLISAMTERLVREFNAAAAGLPASGGEGGGCE